MFVSGQIPLTPSGELVQGDIARETRQALENIRAILVGAGYRLEDVVKTTIYLTDLSSFGEVNEAYAAFFGDHRPARVTVGVAALPRGARVEIEAIAVRSSEGNAEKP
ncbi:MAG: Bona fide RidA/YjgF/TdcF/RutC subgroup [Brockia lithotrophica]|uniref:Bona fide RidA/YjgF/TdcF/RutC subgroup n=1 Tax=Brockia lithotrophica TaxID=933949 RepID=A0A2T5G549_9BACL|nr:MAG: Bona fide RidA/YjgF/TdcF/RutC subgroup [Brockia lithotrophica]